MAESFRFALVQDDFPVGAVAANADKVRARMREAGAAGASVVAFPELTLSGYPPEDLLLRPSFLDACEHELAALAADTDGQAAVLGVPHRHADGTLRNSAALLLGGRVDAWAHKQVLPNYAVFDEKRYFEAAEDTCVVDAKGVRLAVLVCEDIWDDAPVAQAARDGAELILVINASPWDVTKQAQREALLTRHARASGCAIAYVNLVGGQDDLLFDGSSMLVNPDGSVVARAPAFTDAMLMCEFDAATRTLRADGWPPLPDAAPEAVLYAALTRGITDYVGKNGFRDVLLGLSGGIDSALTLALAVDALGAEHVTAVMLPSRYTSEISLDGAREQAEALGVDYHVLAIEDTFEAMLGTLTPAFAGKNPDTTEENLQARIRGAMLMALSNKHGKLLLATGNKSEMAVGYATLYGDMCGAYAPLKDVYKTRVYGLARWRTGPGMGSRDAEAIPQAVIERPPSAELRADQTDQDSLPPYDELDVILEAFIEDEKSQADIIADGHDAETVHRIVRLVLLNEFKRRQAAPGPKVTRRAFGRERRYPISSGWR
ncbi:MAG TPA: NAD+ synthase [Oleiagrimonas sp.]|nr:NAD+ synthase [Oleiagrimonas sp.]